MGAIVASVLIILVAILIGGNLLLGDNNHLIHTQSSED